MMNMGWRLTDSWELRLVWMAFVVASDDSSYITVRGFPAYRALYALRPCQAATHQAG